MVAAKVKNISGLVNDPLVGDSEGSMDDTEGESAHEMVAIKKIML